MAFLTLATCSSIFVFSEASILSPNSLMFFSIW